MHYQTLFLYSEKQNNWKTATGQKFRRGQKVRLIPGRNGTELKERKPEILLLKGCIFQIFWTSFRLGFYVWKIFWPVFGLGWVLKNQDWIWIAKYDSPLISDHGMSIELEATSRQRWDQIWVAWVDTSGILRFFRHGTGPGIKNL